MNKLLLGFSAIGSLFLVSCGGGGSSPATYDLNKFMISFSENVYTLNGSITNTSGNATTNQNVIINYFTDSFTSVTNPNYQLTSFNGTKVSAQASLVASYDATNLIYKTPNIGVRYFISSPNFEVVGETKGSGNVGVYSNQQPLPTNAQIGATGNFATVSWYTDYTQQTLDHTDKITYTLKSVNNIPNLCFVAVSTYPSSSGTKTSTSCYDINTSGQFNGNFTYSQTDTTSSPTSTSSATLSTTSSSTTTYTVANLNKTFALQSQTFTVTGNYFNYASGSSLSPTQITATDTISTSNATFAGISNSNTSAINSTSTLTGGLTGSTSDFYDTTSYLPLGQIENSNTSVYSNQQVLPNTTKVLSNQLSYYGIKYNYSNATYTPAYYITNYYSIENSIDNTSKVYACHLNLQLDVNGVSTTSNSLPSVDKFCQSIDSTGALTNNLLVIANFTNNTSNNNHSGMQTLFVTGQ